MTESPSSSLSWCSQVLSSKAVSGFKHLTPERTVNYQSTALTTVTSQKLSCGLKHKLNWKKIKKSCYQSIYTHLSKNICIFIHIYVYLFTSWNKNSNQPHANSKVGSLDMEEIKLPEGFLLLPDKEVENYHYVGQTCVECRGALGVNDKVLAVRGCRRDLCEKRSVVALRQKW